MSLLAASSETTEGGREGREVRKLLLTSTTCTRKQFKNNYFTEMCSGSEAGS